MQQFSYPRPSHARLANVNHRRPASEQMQQSLPPPTPRTYKDHFSYRANTVLQASVRSIQTCELWNGLSCRLRQTAIDFQTSDVVNRLLATRCSGVENAALVTF